MSPEGDIYTETMAKIYADQGHWIKVVEIYRHLLAREPERLGYADALAEAESRLKMSEIRPTTPDQLAPLLCEWIQLLLKFEELQKLTKLKRGRHLSGLGSED